MRGWLIDTNVVSELRRARPAQKVVTFGAAQPGDVLFTSDVSIAEAHVGIEQISDPARSSDLLHWLDRKLRPLFAGRVLPVTEDALCVGASCWKLAGKPAIRFPSLIFSSLPLRRLQN